jgi:hypothetical protein
MPKNYEPRTRWNVEKDRMEVSSRKDGKTTWALLEWPKPTEKLTEEDFSKVYLRLRKIQYKRKRIDGTQRTKLKTEGIKGAENPKPQDEHDDTEDNIVYQRTAPKKLWNEKDNKGEPIPKKFYYHRTIKTPRTLLYETYLLKELWEYGEEPVKKMLQKFKQRFEDVGVWKTQGWKEIKPPVKSNKKKTYNLAELLDLLQKEEQDKTGGLK